MPSPSLVHTGLAVGTSAGLSDAAVTIMSWLLSLVHVTLPTDVASAFGIVFTALFGLIIHRASTAASANDNSPPKASMPDATAAPAAVKEAA